MTFSTVLVVIFCLVALIFFALGIYAILSKKPVQFGLANRLRVEPDDITDMKRNNRAYATLLIVHGLFMLVLGILSYLFKERDLAWVAFVILAFTVPLCTFILGLSRISSKYTKSTAVESNETIGDWDDDEDDY
jgi:uncharacterized iron-regulated membrane protein